MLNIRIKSEADTNSVAMTEDFLPKFNKNLTLILNNELDDKLITNIDNLINGISFLVFFI